MSWTRLIALAAAALVVITWAIVRPEQLYVEHVEFTGHVRATEAELRHLADLRNGTTLWGVDLDQVSKGVQRHPWVERVEAERSLPNRVVVRVTEHTPVALLAWDDALLYVDDGGAPFLHASSDDLDHPVLTGLSSELEDAHPDLPRLVIGDALWLLDELDARKLVTRDRISEVRFHRTRGFTLQTTGGVGSRRSAEILVGLGDYERQLRRLAALLDRGVDLTTSVHVDLAPERVAIVRPIDTTPAMRAP